MQKWPLISVLDKLFHSRRFVVAIASIATYLITLGVPSLATKSDLIFALLLIVAALLIGSFTLEDVSTVKQQTTSDALTALITELLAALQAPQPAATNEALLKAIDAAANGVPPDVVHRMLDTIGAPKASMTSSTALDISKTG